MSDGAGGRRVIDGRFELEARLGGGGMGTVWRARDLVLDRVVALKEVRPLDPALAEYDPEAAYLLRARVLREARALARVSHPNVVTIHHVVDGDAYPYPWLVMELVTGGTLHDRLARGPMEPVEAAALGREVLAALRAAHGAGIQHRDVKPANVLLRPDGRPVLTDFGIAAIREATALTATGSIIGTPDYMAPERISGDDGGPGSDLWSLAMMLYVAVEGRHPLRRGSTLATLAAVLKEPLPPATKAGPLAAVLDAVLVRDPAARPDAETVDGMLAAVARGAVGAGAGAAPGATEPGPPEPGTTKRGTPEPGTTSYRLAPPGAVPRTTVPYGDVPPPAGGRSRVARRVAIGASLAGTALAVVLLWTLLPDLGDLTRWNVPDSGAQSGTSGTSGVSGARSGPSSGPSSGSPEAGRDLLTPAGIRTAVKALKAEMGTDRVGSFSVYADFVAAHGMVKGSDTRYDSYTYRVDEGVTKGPSSGTLIGGQLPVSMDAFDWDAVPALLKRAAEDLNVDKPTSRYLLVRQPNALLGSSEGMTLYLTNAYGAGYLEADSNGKVVKVNPARS
ncbi:serine/threonine-protein kinase [Streptomyces sp. NPDC059134]|uniref:serine/threonine-protein kinase n=1 Tax=Streptomyces sp. NPDC059134 TaxID=3346738 RepID=UPI0036C22AB2